MSDLERLIHEVCSSCPASGTKKCVNLDGKLQDSPELDAKPAMIRQKVIGLANRICAEGPDMSVENQGEVGQIYTCNFASKIFSQAIQAEVNKRT